MAHKTFGSFAAATGLLPNSTQWQRACRGFKYSGLGLRIAALHGEAAFLASACASREKCDELLSTFSLDGGEATSHFGINLAAYSAKLPAYKHLNPHSISGEKQSDTLDAAAHDHRWQQACVVDQATLTSECQIGGDEYWQVVPSKALGLVVPAGQFVTEGRHRLCMLECQEDGWCPLCDQVLEAWEQEEAALAATMLRATKASTLPDQLAATQSSRSRTCFCHQGLTTPPALSAARLTFTSQPGPMVFLLHLISSSRHLSGKGLWQGQRRPH